MLRVGTLFTTLGLLVLTPCASWAGPKDRPTAAAVNPNQKAAEGVRDALLKARLQSYDIDIQVQGGVAHLAGKVASPQQKAVATQAAMAVPGIRSVDNRLTVGEGKSPVQHAGGAMPQRGAVRPVAYQDGSPMGPPMGMGGAGGGPGGGMGGAGGGPGGGMGGAGTGAPPMGSYNGGLPSYNGSPSYGGSGGYGASPVPYGSAYGQPMGGGAIYDQPNFPNHSWPTYAAYPNYAQVSYPSQYSASAFPYIGPFYPYPQVPLGWRKAQLEWDDGYWQLNFRPRTDRWWWFLDYRNW